MRGGHNCRANGACAGCRWQHCQGWNRLAARSQGRRHFIEERVAHVGAALGAVLAAWNALVGGTFGDYNATRLMLEGLYYFAGSMVLSGLGATLEWSSLRRRFDR